MMTTLAFNELSKNAMDFRSKYFLEKQVVSMKGFHQKFSFCENSETGFKSVKSVETSRDVAKFKETIS